MMSTASPFYFPFSSSATASSFSSLPSAQSYGGLSPSPSLLITEQELLLRKRLVHSTREKKRVKKIADLSHELQMKLQSVGYNMKRPTRVFILSSVLDYVKKLEDELHRVKGGSDEKRKRRKIDGQEETGHDKEKNGSGVEEMGKKDEPGGAEDEMEDETTSEGSSSGGGGEHSGKSSPAALLEEDGEGETELSPAPAKTVEEQKREKEEAPPSLSKSLVPPAAQPKQTPQFSSGVASLWTSSSLFSKPYPSSFPISSAPSPSSITQSPFLSSASFASPPSPSPPVAICTFDLRIMECNSSFLRLFTLSPSLLGLARQNMFSIFSPSDAVRLTESIRQLLSGAAGGGRKQRSLWCPSVSLTTPSSSFPSLPVDVELTVMWHKERDISCLRMVFFPTSPSLSPSSNGEVGEGTATPSLFSSSSQFTPSSSSGVRMALSQEEEERDKGCNEKVAEGKSHQQE